MTLSDRAKEFCLAEKHVMSLLKFFEWPIDNTGKKYIYTSFERRFYFISEFVAHLHQNKPIGIKMAVALTYRDYQ